MDPAVLARIREVSAKLAENHRDWAFSWSVEKSAKKQALEQAWDAGYNTTRTADHAFAYSLDESIDTVKSQAEIKALEVELTHLHFLAENNLPLNP